MTFEHKPVLLNEVIEGLDINYPIAFDMELSENSLHSDLTAEERAKAACAFCETIRAADREAIVYGSAWALEHDIDIGWLTDYPLWMANYAEYPSFNHAFRFWQYSNTGKVPGIHARVDMNLELVPRKRR